ncbi:hypothetical protein Ciccas_012539, partial [Cichlidogyrus casuarinus]
RYTTRPHVEFSGRTTTYRIPEGVDKVFASCADGCEQRYVASKDCYGVYFQRIGTTDVVCELIMQSFDPDSLKPLPDQDFTVGFRPIRPDSPSTTTEAFFEQLDKISTGMENLFVLPINDKSGKPKFNIILSEILKGDADEDDAFVESVDLLSHGEFIKNDFVFSDDGVEIAPESVNVYYGSTYLEDCAEACVKYRRNEGPCDLFDFDTLTDTGFGMIDNSVKLPALPPVAEKIAEGVTLIQCNSLCVENSDKAISKVVLVEFPRKEVCTNFVYDEDTSICYFMPPSMVNADSQIDMENQSNLTQYFMNLKKSFTQTASFNMEKIPSDWVDIKLGERDRNCAENCFTELKTECSRYVECTHLTEHNQLCFVFPANVTISDKFQAAQGSEYDCQLNERGLRMPRATVSHITTNYEYWQIMPTVGLVFLALFMLVLGGALAFVLGKLIRR